MSTESVTAMPLNRRIVTSSLLLMAVQGIGKGLVLLTLPWMTQLFAPDAFGTAALAMTFMSLVAVIALMGMDLSYTRAYLGEQSNRAERIENFAWRFAVLSGGLAAIAGALVWWFWGKQAPSAAMWIGSGILLSVLVAMGQVRTRLHGNYGRLAAALAAGGVVTVAANLAAGLLYWRNGVALVAGTVGGFAATVLVLGWPRGLGQSPLDRKKQWTILAIGLPAVITAPMHWLITSADRWFLAHFVGNTDAGVYAVAATIGSAGALLNAAVIAVWLPEATRLHELQGATAATALGQVMTRIILVMALDWLFTVGLADEAVRLLTTEPFHAAASYVPWLAGAVFFLGIYHIASTGLVFGRRLGPTTVIWLVAAGLAVLLSFVYIPSYGAMAAARIQWFSMAFAALSVIPFAMHQHRFPLPRFRLLAALVLTLVMGIGMSSAWRPHLLLSVLLKLPCLAVLALSITWVGDPWLLRQLRSAVQVK